MKYTQMLDMNMVPEWRNQYLDYQGLNSALHKAIENKNTKSRERGVDMYYELIRFNQKFANYFSQECQAQLDKINTFHKEKLSEMKGKYNNLQDQLDQVLSSAVYREIQPDLSIQNESKDSDSYTVTSISELFKNLKEKIRTTQNGDSPSNSILGGSNNSHTVCSSNLQRAKRISSIAQLFGLNKNGEPTTTTTASSNLATSGFQAGKEKVSMFARKLSEGFSNSAHKLTNNLTFIPGHSEYHGGHQHVLAKLNGLRLSSNKQNNNINNYNSSLNNHKQTSSSSSSNRQLMEQYFQNNSHNNNNNTVSEIDIPQLQTLAGATPQSKKKIIASYKNKIAHLKFAFQELYFNLVLFEQYTQLNYTGFEQILRKHDRMFASTLGRKFYQEHVQTADFYNDLQTIDHLIEGVEHVYTLHFENGNRRKAIEELQVPTNVYKPSSPILDFRVGFELGMFAILFLLVILVGFLSDTGYDWRTVFRLYRSPLILIIFLFQSGISIVIWKHYKINHVLIFELNPRNNLSFHHFLEFGSLLGIIWTISVLMFLFSERLSIRPSICPLLVVIIIVSYLFNPTATCHHQARFWLLRILVSKPAATSSQNLKVTL